MILHDTQSTISRAGHLSLARHDLRSGSIAVCGGFEVPLSGPLAEYVTKTQAEYSAQYASNGGRKRMPGHVLYYVTTPGGYVLGYVTVSGGVEVAPSTEITPCRLGVIREGLRSLAATLPHGWRQLTDEGQHPAGYDDATDSGATFEVYARDTCEDIRAERAPILVTTDRTEALAAAEKAEADGHKGDRSPVGIPYSSVCAWVRRVQPESGE